MSVQLGVRLGSNRPPSLISFGFTLLVVKVLSPSLARAQLAGTNQTYRPSDVPVCSLAHIGQTWNFGHGLDPPRLLIHP